MDKKSILFKRTLVIGVIILFIGVGFKSAFANDVYIIKETKENTDEIGISDDYHEIITWIDGSGDINWINRRGLFRGEVQIVGEGHPIPTIRLHGYRFSNGDVEYYYMSVFDVHLYFFRGFSIGDFIFGIALGNIE
jgi:hypothetical protein